MRKKVVDLRAREVKELKTLLEKKRKELVETRFDLKLKKKKNVHQAQVIRKEIARTLTIIREKELLKKG